MSSPALELVEIRDPDRHPDLLREAFDVVLRPSFDAAELPSYEAVTEGFGDGYEQVVLVARNDEGVVAAAVSGREADAPLGTLSYLAARPGRRGGGVGAAMMARLGQVWAASTVQAMLGEVHDPRAYAESADEQPSARLRFYERAGARLLMVPWMQPGLGGGERVHDMLLLEMYRRAGGPQKSLPSSWLLDWTRTYYEFEEGAVPQDAAYRELERRISEHDPIALVEPGALATLAPLAR